MEVKKYSPLNSLKKIADNLWIVDGEEVLMDFKFFKVPFSTRMTVIRLKNGGIWVHSPIKPSDNLLFEIKQLGEVKHLIAPNVLHYSYIDEWHQLFPEAKVWLASGVQKRARKSGMSLDYGQELSKANWNEEILFTTFEGSFYVKEVVFLVAFGGGMYLVFNSSTTIGSVTAIVQLVNFVVMPLNEVGMGISKFREGQATLDAFEVKDVTELQTGETKEYFDDVISFSNIDFSYPNTEEKIFNHLSLKIQKGEKIAIVGMSGSGKSTLLNLLLRFYDVTSGHISIDNIDLQAISAGSLYNLMTIVQQDIYIFDDTLRSNITLNQFFTDEEIKQAVQQSGLESYVLENESGLQALCGENGSNLSGGQKQRLSIARALIRKTPILLLDEATSSLDNQVTTEIENSILDIQDLTALVVTHKLNENILKKYDRILFMKGGVIVEDGSFGDLMDRRGEFYKLFELSV